VTSRIRSRNVNLSTTMFGIILLGNRIINFGFHKRREICWPAERLLSSEEDLCSVEFGARCILLLTEYAGTHITSCPMGTRVLTAGGKAART
jgi:hypothetical protein